jgi:hypothetical protein
MSERTQRPSTRVIMSRVHALAQDTIRLTRCARESNGGGAGIRTPVRKYILTGIYDAYPPLLSRARRGEAAKPPGANPEKSRR